MHTQHEFSSCMYIVHTWYILHPGQTGAGDIFVVRLRWAAGQARSRGVAILYYFNFTHHLSHSSIRDQALLSMSSASLEDKLLKKNVPGRFVEW